MSTTVPKLFRLVIKNPTLTKAQQAAKTVITNEFTTALDAAQARVLGRTDVFTPQKVEEITQALAPANKDNRVLQNGFQALQAQESDFAALTRTQFGKKSATVQSVPVANVKHPILTKKVARQKDQTVDNFVTNTLDNESKPFIEALAEGNRTPRVSPRIATRKDGVDKTAVAKYKETVDAFKSDAELTRIEEESGTAVKILQNGKGRVQLPGQLYIRHSQKEGEDLTAFKTRLTGVASDVSKAVAHHVNNNNPYLSARMLRKNTISYKPFVNSAKQINIEGVKNYNQVAAQMAVTTNGKTTQQVLAELERDRGIKVKVMDNKVRITRHDIHNNVVATYTRKLTSGVRSMEQLFNNALEEAQEMATTPLPEQKASQKVRNFFHPLKKGLLNMFNPSNK